VVLPRVHASSCSVLGGSLAWVLARPACLLLSGCLLLFGCQTKSASAEDPDDDVTRGEAARLCHSIDRLREADNAQKGEWLRALAQEPCSRLCQLKQVCESAYQEHVSALDAIREVKAYGAELPAPGSSAGAQITEKLADAERRLRESRKLASQCVESQSEVKRRFRL
jgi:hypothetical protein